MKIKGRIFLITDEKGKLIDNIDTDQIYHNAYLYVTEPDEMARYAFGNLKGYEDFSKKVKKNDIIIVGSNFGAGSSRQHAVDCFLALKIGAIVAESFGAIYKRNAINRGLLIIECPGIKNYLKENKLKDGDSVELDFEQGVLIKETGEKITCKKPSKIQIEIFKKGGLLNVKV